MVRTFDCPACSAPLEFSGTEKAKCRFCGSNIIVPGKAFIHSTVEEYLSDESDPYKQGTPMQAAEAVAYLRSVRQNRPPKSGGVQRRAIIIFALIAAAGLIFSGLVPTVLAIVFALIAAIAGVLSSL